MAGQVDILGIGILLVVLGGAFWLTTRYLLRAVPDMQAQHLVQPAVLEPKGLLAQRDAVILIQSGGRVLQINPAARKLFHLDENEIPGLERLARRVRPSEKFLEICASDGVTDLILDGHPVEVSSYRVLLPVQAIILVTLRQLEQEANLSDLAGRTGGQTPQLGPQFTQLIGSSLDLETTMQSIQQSIEHMLQSDLVEIALWDPATELLVPYRFIGAEGTERTWEVSVIRHRLDDGYVGRIAKDRQPLLVDDFSRHPNLWLSGGRGAQGLQSMIGVPLVVQDELVGVLVAGSVTRDAFSGEDLNLLHMLAGPASIALSNACRFREEQHRAAELSGLAQLAQGFSSARDPKNLFSRLVDSIAPLIKVNILGFLIYNENTRILEGEEPIRGLPSQFVEIYRVPVLPNSPSEQMLLNQDLIITEFAAEAPEWETLGLGYLARAASLRDTVLVPLVSGGRMLGYLQASNHTDNSQVFTQDEIHLLTIIANQAAPVIENVTLVMQARQRVQRAEALRRIASLASSAATLDEILKFALQELSHLLQADLAFIVLLDQVQGVLRLHQKSVYGRPDLSSGLNFTLLVDDPQYHFTVTGASHALSTRNINEEKAIIPFYQQLTQAWQVVSAVAVPLVVRDEGIGEVWLCSRQTGAFDQGDLQVVATAAGQLAGVVEQSVLSTQTDESLRRRVEQLTALTRVSRELNSSRDLKALLGIVYDEALRITGVGCGSILLFDLEGAEESAYTVRYYTGEPPSDALSEREMLALRNGETINLPDLDQMGIVAPHANVVSLLIVPIRYQTRSVGLIILHGQRVDSFQSDEVEVIQSLASQAAIALGDAYLYEGKQQQDKLMQRRLNLVDRIHDLSQSLRSNRSLPEILEGVATAIRMVTPFQVVVISVYEPAQNILSRVVGAGLEASVWEELQANKPSWDSLRALLQPQFRIGSTYYIPADQRPRVPSGMHLVTVLHISEDEKQAAQDVWNPKDILLIPLFTDQQAPLGLISVDVPMDGRKPDRISFDALEILAAQAALAIETWQQVSLRDTRLMQAEAEQERLKQAADQARVQIPLFLRHNLEQTLSIQRLNRQMERVRAGLDIAERANSQSDALAVLRSLARELLTRFDMQAALVAESTPTGVRLLDVIGSVPSGANPEALFGQRNPLRQLLQDGKVYLAADVDETPEWRTVSLLTAMGARSFIALPLEIDSDHRGGVMAIGLRALVPFNEEDHQIYTQLSRQISLGTLNLNLLTETQRRLHEMDLLLEFSRKLGMLNPRGILTTLIETVLEVLPTGDAGWVALWEDNQGLVPQAASGYTDNMAMLSIHYMPGDGKTLELLPLRVLSSGLSVRTDVAFAQDYSLPSEDLLRYRKATGGRLPVSCLIAPIGRGSRMLGVLVIDHFSLSNAFTQEDEALAVSLAQQSALALENAHLFMSAEQRAAQLQALNQVSGALTSSLQRGELISSLLEQLQLVLPFETATLWLREGSTLTIAAATGFADNESRLGISVAVQESALFKEMVLTGQPVLVPDVRQDARFPSLLVPDHLCWLGIPLIAKFELLGAIALEKHEPGYYTPDYLQAASTFASQAGVALENARLFEESAERAAELDQRSQRLTLLNRLSSELGSSLDENTILRLTCLQVLGALGVSRVSAVLIDEQGDFMVQFEAPDGTIKLPRHLPATPLLERLRETQGIFSTVDVSDEAELKPLVAEYFAPYGVHSVVFVPLVTAVWLHGWVVIQTTTPYRFTPSEIDLARTMSNQASAALQNARLYNETRRLTQDLERRVEERTSDVRREHNNTQALLRIITELSTSLDLDMVMNRTLTVLNETIGAEQSLIVMNSGKNYRAGVELVTRGSDGVPVKGSPEREISRWITRRRVPALVDNILDDARWNFKNHESPVFRSVIAVPLILGEEASGALLLLHRRPGAFMIEQVSLVEATARQFGISLNNAELFTLIRDQAEHLGGLLREQQIEASRSRAILESVADGVVVTDDAMSIILFNASAERILDLKTESVLGKSLDAFIGLFGKAGQVWRETIQRWSANSQTYQPGETYAEQINMDNGQVVAVNLAPVFYRNQFLATVSIFRDITHEVQVDRMKSEFVANVSHELRTPMTSIKGYVEIMLMGAAGELSPQQRHFLTIVKGNTERLNVLVNDLLDVSRIEAGRVVLSLQALDLREVVAEVISDMQRRSRQESKPMTFSLEVPGDLPKVTGDATRIRQVLMNLVNNGYNYSPENGRVVIRMHPEDGKVQVDVIDHGIGIGVKDQARIFERFYRGEDPLVLATAGTGLGLAISKILIEMHHGRIWFYSSGVRGEGSVFSFTLPVKQSEE